ncbi:MAG TPA: serine/threonine-protein kinase, partial [Allosphingosinicella sp.]|nr:serine/threonine-protein kinase [Allosphingosinicella sp.]
SPAPPTAFAPREAARPIRVGDVLNHIFEVKSFLARGGMGEVFEGCNVNTDERVAIKVMLPALAADEKVVAMFRKEARTLTKLQHEALVSYRVLAQEPQIGVLYIVTEFIEGVSLSEVLGKVERTPEELAGLLKRLAAGLSAAHRLGAIHRDMSPDNVLLPGGDVHQAKIIDFGIAKDLDASSATIVGDGFAGKLNYVAPEQLGDYGREVGPWTDVYSLALVILAVAQGRSVDMSGSLVDAIDKRRKGPDLSAAPDSLRPLLEAMLRPDPKERLRSMDEVLARLGGAPAEAPGPAAPAAPAEPRRGGSRALIVGLVIAAALAVAAASWYVLSRAGGGLIPVPRDEVSGNIVAPAADPTETARNAINSVLPSVSCTWLDIASIGGGGDGVAIAMRGVAGDGEAARRELASALASAGVENARLDFADVAPILPAGCAALDTYRQVRASSGRHLSIAQPRFEMAMQPPGLPYAGSIAANAVIDLDLGDAATDFAIAGIEPSGAITALIPSRTDFQAAVAQSVNGRPIADQGNGRYRLNVDLDHQGWSGLILVSGQGPFVPDLIAPPVGARGPAWQQQFLAAASQGNWRVEMVWFESVDREGNDAASGMPAPEPAPDGGKLP